jgi:hypothetical protein
MPVSHKKKKKASRPESVSELYRPSDRRSSAKLMPAFVGRGCHVVSVTDPYGHILDFLASAWLNSCPEEGSNIFV